MIKKNKAALIAIHRLLIKGRQIAHEEGNEVLFKFFDEIETLPVFILDDQNLNKDFEFYLKEVCTQYDCKPIYNRFIEGKDLFGNPINE